MQNLVVVSDTVRGRKSQSFGDAGASPTLYGDVAYPLWTRYSSTCYHTNFHRSGQTVRVYVESKTFLDAAARPVPKKHGTTLHAYQISSLLGVIMEIGQEILTP